MPIYELDCYPHMYQEQPNQAPIFESVNFPMTYPTMELPGGNDRNRGRNDA